MANTWIARDHQGTTVEFRSCDLDVNELAETLYTPFEIRDKTDDMRPVAIVKEENVRSMAGTPLLKIEWYSASDWLKRCDEVVPA